MSLRRKRSFAASYVAPLIAIDILCAISHLTVNFRFPSKRRHLLDIRSSLRAIPSLQMLVRSYVAEMVSRFLPSRSVRQSRVFYNHEPWLMLFFSRPLLTNVCTIYHNRFIGLDITSPVLWSRLSVWIWVCILPPAGK